MRIIAGQLGGRRFDSPHSHQTHPMSDKIRGALFNILGDIKGLTVLDAFGGSGALAFEAISRGARQVTVLERDKAAQAIIKANAQALAVSDRVRLVAASAAAWLSTNESAYFDIVLCDPPYDQPQAALLNQLALRTRSSAVVVLSLPPSTIVALQPDFVELATKLYGDAQLRFYRREASAAAGSVDGSGTVLATST